MTQFRIHTLESAPADSRPALEALQKDVGFVPNLAATMADSPTLIDVFTRLRKILAGGSFTPLERETIALSVSYENRCTYCMAAHSTFATLQGVSAADLGSLRAGRAPGEPRLRALATYTRQLMATRGHVSEETIGALHDAGFTRAQALEAVAMIAFTVVANYVHNIARSPVDEPFQPQAWAAPA